MLSDMMVSEGHEEFRKGEKTVSKTIRDYKDKVNEHLKIFSVDLRGYGKSLNLDKEFTEANFVRIYGMSD